MLNKELISAGFPTLKLDDTVSTAIEAMEKNNVQQMVVLEDDKYVGLAFDNDLLNFDDSTELKDIQQHFSRVAVKNERHFLEAVQSVMEYNLSIVPVVGAESEFFGSIQAADLLLQLGKMTGAGTPGGLIELAMPMQDFSFAEIIKLVETNDAQITQLNTYWDTEYNIFIVTIRVNKFEISDIVATFQRYDYNVRYYFGEEIFENELKSNLDHLMNYLSI